MIRTEVDVVLLVDAKMAALFTTVLSSRVSRVSVMISQKTVPGTLFWNRFWNFRTGSL